MLSSLCVLIFIHSSWPRKFSTTMRYVWLFLPRLMSNWHNFRYETICTPFPPHGHSTLDTTTYMICICTFRKTAHIIIDTPLRAAMCDRLIISAVAKSSCTQVSPTAMTSLVLGSQSWLGLKLAIFPIALLGAHPLALDGCFLAIGSPQQLSIYRNKIILLSMLDPQLVPRAIRTAGKLG